MQAGEGSVKSNLAVTRENPPRRTKWQEKIEEGMERG